MTIKTAILAAVIGFATITGPIHANAAPLGIPAATAEAGTTQVGGGHGRHHFRRHGHFRRHKNVFYKRFCFDKKIRIWSHAHGGWIFKYKTVCRKRPVFY